MEVSLEESNELNLNTIECLWSALCAMMQMQANC